MKKYRIVFLFWVMCLFACQGKQSWQKSTFMYFDTLCEINLFCTAADFVHAQEEVRRIFSMIDENFAPQAKDYQSPLVLDLFRKGMAVYDASQGSFDITVAPLSDLWGFQTKNYIVPSPEMIMDVLIHVGMKKITPGPDGLSLPPGVSLDWGGIAKGFGIDLAAQVLIELGVQRGFINAGGDLYCWGANPENNPWQIGIKHPRQEGYLGVFSLSGLGAATTGDYQRFFMHAGKRYHHVFDPKTGYPAQGKQSVTVVGPETGLCDALSTALFVSKEPEVILEKFPEYGAVIVDTEGKIERMGKVFTFQLWN